MRLQACSALLLLLVACATASHEKVRVDQGPRLANLQRAAALPWKDDGRCVVQEASNSWPVVVERCFHSLDTRRVRFRDTERRCPVATADAASLEMMVGICLLSQPELVVGAVLVTGAVGVALAIHEALEASAHARYAHPEDEPSQEVTKPEPQVATTELQAPQRQPEGSPSGGNRPPPVPPEALEPRERRPECTPVRVKPKGGNSLHNQCADGVPGNTFRGANALVNGKAFDAFQPATRTLWEVKTTAIETYNPFIQRTELAKQVEEAQREQKLALACGYQFIVGVRTQFHKRMLEDAVANLNVVLMLWC
jgi:hypothetical protein